MGRAIWNGHITFGLVNVPVLLFAAEQANPIHFHLLDSRDSAAVKYKRVNEASGAEVPWNKVVKGYQQPDGNTVIVADKDLKAAAPAMTKRIEIEQFVDLHEIDVMFFDKPYYLVPDKGGEKGYVLLREAMAASKRVGIAKVVIRARGHLAALMPQGDALILELLRFADELQDIGDYKIPRQDDPHYKVTKKELDLAKQLVSGMTSGWDAQAYHDEYRVAVEKMLDELGQKAGKSTRRRGDEAESESPRTVNFMEMLRKSVQRTGGSTAAPVRARRKSKSTATKKRAG